MRAVPEVKPHPNMTTQGQLASSQTCHPKMMHKDANYTLTESERGRRKDKEAGGAVLPPWAGQRPYELPALHIHCILVLHSPQLYQRSAL